MRGAWWTWTSMLGIVTAALAGLAWAAGEVKLLASDGAASDRFGTSVSLDGDRAAVGASLNDDDGDRSGSAYVYERLGGVWVETAKLTAADGVTDAQFGSSLSIAGDRLIVGAHGDDDNGPGTGSAYLFEAAGGAWIEVQKLTASDGTFFDNFGWSVCMSGDTALISAIGTDVGGGAYVFESLGGVWTETAKILPPDPLPNYRFGQSVALDVDTAVVGAMFDSPSGTSSGSAYVFARIGGAWVQEAKLVASDGADFDNFGVSVSVSDGTIVVGALRDDGNAGSAYVFRKVGGAWIEIQKLKASDRSSGHAFGRALALAGKTLLVAAPGADGNSLSDGAAYVFRESGGLFAEAAKLAAPGGASVDQFGNGVALSADLALVGVPGDDDNGSASGSAWIFEVEEPVLVAPIDVIPGNAQNMVNPQSQGVIAVAILTTDTFDATEVDGTTVRFGPNGASEAHTKKPMGHFEDIDLDGDTDLVFHFETQATGIACGDTSVTLMGELLDGTPFEGEDAIVTTGC